MTFTRNSVLVALSTLFVAALIVPAAFLFANDTELPAETSAPVEATETSSVEEIAPSVETPTNEIINDNGNEDSVLPLKEEHNDSGTNGELNPENGIEEPNPEIPGAPQCSDTLDNELSEYDFNGDREIDIDDFSLLAADFNEPASSSEYPHMDLSGNGTIDQDDFDMFKIHFGYTVGDGLIDEQDPDCRDSEGNHNPNNDSEYLYISDEEPTPSCVIVSPNKKFDFNVDGVINIDDFSTLAAKYGTTVSAGTPEDVNKDGQVNEADFILFKAHFGEEVIEDDTSECPVDEPENPSNNDNDNSGRNGRSGGRRSLSNGRGGSGEVLGATTMCAPYLSQYLRMGSTGEEVTKLQSFLNEQLGGGLPLTGVFGQMTHDAVNKFQLMHNTDVLKPWVAYGLPNENTPTGYVYKTTSYKINSLFCPGSVSAPILP